MTHFDMLTLICCLQQITFYHCTLDIQHFRNTNDVTLLHHYMFSRRFFAIQCCTSFFTFWLYTISLKELNVLYVQDANLNGMLSFKNEVTL